MDPIIRRSSTALIVSGVLALVLGLVLVSWPIASAVTLMILIGAYALVDGIFALVSAFNAPRGGTRGFLVLSGVIGIVAGLIALVNPIFGAATLVWVLGVWLLVRGVLEIVSALRRRSGGPRWLLVLGGLLWLVAGVIFVVNPTGGVVAFTVLIGILAVAWGLLSLVAGIVLRVVGRRAARASG
ncbi:DUF308 domain-containing protein [Rothia sp. AR01]|uniref:DUF308 domain-containing protein n=1 Tax=Rothia santali TaxID=2949643 RepID=A0A9X2HE97_9MICC|nr:DUF308 domain-containing protein [Rothia santali]MCP3426705.1 DUF308 domain-containing protein [Rothia santali]